MSLLKSKRDDGNEVEGILNQKFLTVSFAVKITGYNGQYLRRLLRAGKLSGVRVGQVWLISFNSLEEYLNSVHTKIDQRCGPKKQPQ